jgi:hypothetical protein
MATVRGLDLDEARLAGPLIRKDVVADPERLATTLYFARMRRNPLWPTQWFPRAGNPHGCLL